MDKRGSNKVVDWVARVILILPIFLHFVFLVKTIFEFPLSLIGIVPVVIGLFINLQTSRILMKREEGRFEKPKILVNEGLFRYSRNPIYLGVIVFALGLAILLGSLVSFGFPIIMFLIAHFYVIPDEEEQLQIIFGKEYLDYMKRVRRWI